MLTILYVIWLGMPCYHAQETGPPTEEEVLKTISEGMTNVLREAKELTFTAYLTHEATRYKADVKMGVGILETRVYDLDSSLDKPIAVAIQGEESQWSKNVNGCLFGTLQKSWIGPEGSPPSFAKKILDGRLEKNVDVEGRQCYVISCFQKSKNSSWVDVLYVDATEFLPIKWLTTEFLPAKWWRTDGSVTRTRVYTNIYLKGNADAEKTVSSSNGSGSSPHDLGRRGRRR